MIINESSNTNVLDQSDLSWYKILKPLKENDQKNQIIPEKLRSFRQKRRLGVLMNTLKLCSKSNDITNPIQRQKCLRIANMYYNIKGPHGI